MQFYSEGICISNCLCDLNKSFHFKVYVFVFLGVKQLVINPWGGDVRDTGGIGFANFFTRH